MFSLKSSDLDSALNIGALVQVFRDVKSRDECFDLMREHKLIQRNGLSQAHCVALERVCASLRTESLAMEPNLLGRAVAAAVVNRRQSARVTLALSVADTDFQRYIQDGDRARDNGDFPSAEYSYWLALQLFPNHPGFLVQYAHALKEQGKTLDALIRYLDAFFLGANRSDVQPHAIHTAESTGFRSAVLPVLQRSTPGMVPNESSDAPLGIVSTDVMAATKLMHKRTPSKRELVSYMCEAATWPELMLSLMKEKVFSSTHRKLLRLIHETGWNA